MEIRFNATDVFYYYFRIGIHVVEESILGMLQGWCFSTTV